MFVPVANTLDSTFSSTLNRRDGQTPPQEPHLFLVRPTPRLAATLSAGRRHSLVAAAAGQALSLLNRNQITAAFTLAERAATGARALICAFPRKPAISSEKVTYSDTHTKAIHILLHIAVAATKAGDRDLTGKVLHTARKASFYLSPLYNLCEAKIAHHEGHPFRPDPAFPMAEERNLLG
ncbi:MAG: hypothetical protein PHW63_04615 [Alphaproteobacteria bacterium]|nr:hypothetical protein [Alphaproteobacteria bacterium]